jgi:hypothetical protein
MISLLCFETSAPLQIGLRITIIQRQDEQKQTNYKISGPKSQKYETHNFKISKTSKYQESYAKNKITSPDASQNDWSKSRA